MSDSAPLCICGDPLDGHDEDYGFCLVPGCKCVVYRAVDDGLDDEDDDEIDPEIEELNLGIDEEGTA
jgi:hypothetical protein